MTMPQLTLLAVMAWLFISSCFSLDPIVKNWELEWNAFVLPEEAYGTVEGAVKNLIRNPARREALAKTPPKSVSYLKPIDWTDPRMAPVCRLSAFRLAMLSGTCSCAFIKPHMVVTAAHCLSKHGVTPKSGHMLYVQEKFGSDLKEKKAKEASHDDYKPNIVTEWWFPTAYSAKGKNANVFDIARYDIAFLKTRHNGGSAYALTPAYLSGSHSVGTENMAILGYPDAYLSSEVGVMTTGTMSVTAEGIDDIVNDAAKAKELASASMTEGGSGGPIILSKAGLDDYTGKHQELKELLKMAVFSVTGLAGKPGTANAFANFVVEVSPKLVKAMEHIYAVGPKGEGSKVLSFAEDGNAIVQLTSVKE